MSVLNINGLKKILGAQEILRGVALRVDNGEKVGCVGRNGEGKTTLLRLIEGEETPDEGSAVIAKGARLGYVTQRPAFDAGVTVRSYVEGGLDEVHAVEADLTRVAEAMAEAGGAELDSLTRRHGELTARMDFLGGWESERRVETVLGGIGLPEALWDREARTLSGGEKSRTAMARELVSVPDLLLLDEPTNHLDLAGIEWLEAYLGSIASAVFMVSHDRRLLDHLVDTIVEIENGKLHRFPGNYSRYVMLKEERYVAELRKWEQQREHLRKEETFIKKHMGSQRTGEAKGRRRRLEGIERLERPYNDVRKPVLRLVKVERGGEQVLETENLSVGYDGKPLLEGVEVRIGRGERIGVVGSNGSGKTTLLKCLAGRLPALGGEARAGYKAVCGYFDQEITDLREDGTPFTEIRRDHPQMTDLEIRSHLASFLFRGAEVDFSVKRLSGGERARLSLARLVLTKPSWLALDEPTNHLDLAGRTALEEMLASFPGALVVITHDREFLDHLSDRIIEVENGRVRQLRGNYSDYRALVVAEEAERAEKAAKQRRKAEERARAETAVSAAGPRKKGGRGGTGPKNKKPHNPWRFKRLEESIMALEAERERLLGALATEEVYKDAQASREAQVRLAEVERDLEDKNREWEQSI